MLILLHLTARHGPRLATVLLGPVIAVLLVVFARHRGLSYEELGLGWRHLRRGAVFAGVAIGAVVAVYLLALLFPSTRAGFLDQRYQLSVAGAMVTALVVIPLATVVPEEVAFRGVLWALAGGNARPALATAVSSVLFGLWHLLPSLGLARVNPAVAGLVGTGMAAGILAAAGAVLFTGLAGVALCELRRRSGSLLAPIGLHWAVNGLGVLITAVLAKVS